MDRRHALRKLGAGAAVGLAGTAIVSSPAFAYAQPTVLTGPGMTVSLAPGNNTVANVTIQDGAADCTGSAIPTNATFVSRSVDLTGTTVAVFGFPGRWLLGGAPLPVTTVAAAFPLQRQVLTFFGTFNFTVQAGDTLTAAISVTWRCTYSDMTTRDLTTTQTRTATYLGGGSWSVV